MPSEEAGGAPAEASTDAAVLKGSHGDFSRFVR